MYIVERWMKTPGNKYFNQVDTWQSKYIQERKKLEVNYSHVLSELQLKCW